MNVISRNINSLFDQRQSDMALPLKKIKTSLSWKKANKNKIDPKSIIILRKKHLKNKVLSKKKILNNSKTINKEKILDKENENRKIQLGNYFFNSLFIASIKYSHIFAHINELFLQQNKKKNNVFYKFILEISQKESNEIKFFLTLVDQLIDQISLENLNAISNNIVEKIKNYEVITQMEYITNKPFYQFNIDKYTASIVNRILLDKNKFFENNHYDITFETIENYEKWRDTKLVAVDTDLHMSTFSIEQTKNPITTIKEGINLYIKDLYKAIKKNYITTILISSLLDISTQYDKNIFKEILSKSIFDQNTLNKSIILFQKGCKKATDIINNLWQLIIINENLFTSEELEKIKSIQKSGSIVTYWQKKIIKPEALKEKFKKILPIAAKTTAYGIMIGASIFLASKLTPTKFSNAASFAYDNTKKFYNTISSNISEWNQETSLLRKAWDIGTGNWIAKIITYPFNYAFNEAEKSIGGQIGTDNFIKNFAINAASGLLVSSISSKIIYPLMKKFNGNFSIVEKTSDAISSAVDEKRMKHNFFIDTKNYINNSLKKFNAIEAGYKYYLPAYAPLRVIFGGKTGKALNYLFRNTVESISRDDNIKRQEKSETNKMLLIEKAYEEGLRKGLSTP